MKKKILKKKNHRPFFILAAAFLILLAATLVFSLFHQNPLTGAASANGVTMSNCKLSGTGYSVSCDLSIDAPTTKKLSDKSTQLSVAASIADYTNTAWGLANDGLKSLLNLPSIPDAVGILSSITAWLNSNAPDCLRQIGTNYNGKTFSGKYYYSISKGAGSYLYPDWDYYYATSTYTSGSFNCKEKLGCVFSFKPKTGEISKSCFG